MHERKRIVLLGVVGVLAPLGCRSILGLGSLSFDGGGGAGGGAIYAGVGGGSTFPAGGAPAEDCTNGKDDDGDGAADCADARCQSLGFTCIAALPPGWNGPIAFFEGLPDAVAGCPETAPNLSFQAGSGLSAPEAMCSWCACTPPITSCAPMPLRPFKLGGCTTKLPTIQPAPGDCVPIGSNVAGLIEDAPVATSGGPCVASGGLATLPALKFTTVRYACEMPAPGGGCPGGELCVASKPDGSFRGGCIWKDGDVACPDGLVKHASLAVTDTRACSPCTCDMPTPAACSAMTAVYSDTTCTTKVDEFADKNQCVNESQKGATAVRVTTTATKQSCTSSGGSPIGSALQDMPKTVCCPPP